METAQRLHSEIRNVADSLQVWEVAAEADEKTRKDAEAAQVSANEEATKRREEIRQQAIAGK